MMFCILICTEMAFWHVIIGSGSRGEEQSQAVWGESPQQSPGLGAWGHSPQELKQYN